jgi:hypothetical protein
MAQNKNNAVVSNSSPIINLSKIDCLFLLEKIFKKVFIPYAVYDELVVKGSEKEFSYNIKSLIDDKVLIINEVKDKPLVKALNKDLDFGESEAIALAIEKKANLIILDEIEAREIASIYNLNKTGFIGVLIKAKKMNLIESVKMYLDLAIEKGFWINETLYEKILRQMSEL